MSSFLRNYFGKIGGKELLTKEKEIELAQRVEQGDEEARDELITANLKLVVSIAKKYRDYGSDFEDLIQAGNMGLIKAVDRFDWRKGYKFSTYATWWIRQRTLRELHKHGRTIRLPEHQHKKIRRIRKAQKQLKKEGKRTNPQNISEKIKSLYDQEIPPDTVLETQRKTQFIGSLDEKIKEAENNQTTKVIFVKDKKRPLQEKLQEEKDKEELHEIMSQLLSNREERILKLRYGVGNRNEMTLQETGKVFGLSRERVRQLQQRAIGKLKNYFLDHPEQKPQSIGAH